MIITRTPLRITLGGGGTDLPAYYSKYGGFVFSAAIDKYMYLSVNRPFIDDLIRIKYSKSEIVQHLNEVQHDLAREALRFMDIKNGIEIDSLADVPAGTGLGSSSCYAVGLLNALHVLKRQYISQDKLAWEANKLEASILGKPVGKQDHYIASFGGLTVLDISKGGVVKVRSAKVSPDTIDHLNWNILTFFTNTSRDANEILKEQSTAIAKQKKEVVEGMHYIKELGYKVLEAVESGNITKIGSLFDKHWKYKKKISNKMSNKNFDHIYKIARQNGALGGKISGAGGGGFFTFYVEKNHTKFRKIMREIGLREMKYHFDFQGTKVLVDV